MTTVPPGGLIKDAPEKVEFNTSAFKAYALGGSGLLIGFFCICAVLGFIPDLVVEESDSALFWAGGALGLAGGFVLLKTALNPPTLTLSRNGIFWRGRLHPWGTIRGYCHVSIRRTNLLYIYFDPAADGASTPDQSASKKKFLMLQPKIFSDDGGDILPTIMAYFMHMRGEPMPDLGLFPN